MSTERVLTKNATFQKLESLKINRTKRHQEKKFFVEGVRNINEAVKNNWKIVSFIYCFENQLSDWAKSLINNVETDVNYEFSSELMNNISGKDDTSELLAIIEMASFSKEFKTSENPIIALFDRPAKKANLGTIIRSCDALGVELLAISGHGVDLYDPEVISSTMGSFFKVPFIKLDENNEIAEFLNDLKKRFPKIKIVGTTSHNKEIIYNVNMKDPVLFLIGNETEGLNKYLIEQSDVLATIPMDNNSSASSLNVSQAASIMFYEAKRQRDEKR